MDRRGFLRMVSAVAATVALPVPQFVLAESGIVVPGMAIELGTIRTLAQHSIQGAFVCVRMDAFNKATQEQFHVDFRIMTDIPEQKMREEYLRAREPATIVLRNMIEHHKWRADDMVALPIPAGYHEPLWMRANA